jgi:chromosomal replication initiator protein
MKGIKLQVDVVNDIKLLKNELRQRVGEKKYEVWFSNSEFRMENDRLSVVAPNSFMSGLLKKNFRSDIDECARIVSGSNVIVSFDTGNCAADLQASRGRDERAARRRTMPVTPPVVISDPTASHDRRNKRSYKHTLDTFIVGSKNKMAFNAAKIAAETPGKVYNPLFFYGTYGIGKTHLLQAICNQAAKTRANAVCVYVSAEEFTNEYVNALRSSNMDSFRKKYRNVDILAIDDIHFLARKSSTQEEFLHTFNTIDLADKQVVLASDAHPTMIAELADSLVNRFVSGMVVKIEAPDYETRLRICEQKLLDMGVSIEPQIIEYVAEHITKSVRDLEGALMKLNAHVMLTGEKLSIAVAQYLLGQSIQSAAPAISPEGVISCVTAFFSITTKDIKSARKDRTISLARAVAMHILRENTDMSLPEIGKVFGGKNHATVILACKKIKALIDKNNQASWKVNGISRSENIATILRQLSDSI